MSEPVARPKRGSRPARAAYVPDPWPGARLRFGVIVLTLDHATEQELPLMVPRERAEFFVSRVEIRNPVTIDNLRRTGDDLGRAATRLLPGTPLQGIAYACTSGAIAVGEAQVRECIRSARPDFAEVPISTPVVAAEAALERLGTRRVAVLTPYMDEVNDVVRDHLEAHGCEVVGLDSFHLDTDLAMTSVPPPAIGEAGRALMSDRPDADALFICCTALRPSGVIAEVEAATGRPVVTSHQAMLWDMLRRAGYDGPPLRGYGRLLESL